MPPPTFEGLKAKARDWLAVDAGRIADSVIGDCLNLGMRDLAREHDLWFNEQRHVENVDANSPGLDLPEDFSRPFSIKYRLPGEGKTTFLEQRGREEFENEFPEEQTSPLPPTGLPKVYALWAGLLWFGPRPDRTITVTSNYYSVPADLTDDVLGGTNQNLFTKYAWETIFFRGLVYATRYLLEDPRKALWQELAQESETRLLIEHSRARHAGRRLVMEEPG